MSFESGLVQLVQSTPAVASLSTGGFLRQLPPQQPLPAWTWSVVSRNQESGLQFFSGFCKFIIQIDIYGASPNDTVPLSSAIDTVLNGYSGAFPDPNSTVVTACFRTDEIDEPFDPDSRIYRRILEYEMFTVL